MRTVALLLISLACVAAQCTNGADDTFNATLRSPISSNPSLVVWTYDAFESGVTNAQLFGPYAQQYGLNMSNIVICKKQSVGLINAIKSIPADMVTPNIVLGLDNVLEFLAPQSNFTDFTAPREVELIPLVTTLGHFEHMKPFDYGLIGVYFNIALNPELYAAENNKEFNLPWFITSNLIHKFVAINPTKDTAGLAFLMWTIAELGDPVLNITGKTNFTGGWRAWWQSAFQQNMQVSDSWDAAFRLFESNASIVNMMSSYGSSPAYDFCPPVGNDQTRAITSWYNNQRFGWAQVEAVGILKNNTNTLNFIDYLLSVPFQNNISNANFMNPVNKNATVQSCYAASVIQPQDVTLLNTYITANELSSYLQNQILGTWQTLYNTYAASSSSASPSSSTGMSSSSTTSGSTGMPSSTVSGSTGMSSTSASSPTGVSASSSSPRGNTSSTSSAPSNTSSSSSTGGTGSPPSDGSSLSPKMIMMAIVAVMVAIVM